MRDDRDFDEVLERVSSDCFWVPEHVRVVENEAIKYAHSLKPSRIYNRVFRVRPDEADPVALVDEVLEAHRGRESRWMLTNFSDSARLRQLLADAGYEATGENHAYSIATENYDRTVPDVDVHQVESVDDLRVLYEVAADAFDRSIDHGVERLRRELASCTGPGRRIARFVAHRDDEPAGCAGMTFFEDADFALVWAAGVRRDHRGHGVYTALLAERARLAAARGIS